MTRWSRFRLVSALTVCLALVLLVCAAPERHPGEVEAYYFGFRALPYEPVTLENIEEMAGCYFRFPSSGAEAIEIRVLLEDAEAASFDRQNVRLLLRGLRSEDLYFDSQGTVAHVKGREGFRIGEDSFERLVRLLDSMAARAGCIVGRPHKD